MHFDETGRWSVVSIASIPSRTSIATSKCPRDQRWRSLRLRRASEAGLGCSALSGRIFLGNDRRVGIQWMNPIVIRSLFRAPSVDACQVFARGRVDARRLRELSQTLLYVVEPFEVDDRQQTKVAARRQTRPADLLPVESPAEAFDVPVEVVLVEDLI